MVKKGPPYLEDPGATFIVISNPWGGSRDRNRIQGFTDNAGAWLRYVGRQPPWNGPNDDVLCDTIFTKNSTDIIIARFPKNTDLSPYLGAHRWSDFLKSADLHGTSYIFEYNYRDQGDPANHSWSERYPRSDAPPLGFPIKYPYPRPTYAKIPYSLDSLAKAMPEPVPQIESLESVPQSHEDESDTDRKPSIKQEALVEQEDSKDLAIITHKRDPFEEGEAATRLVQSSGFPANREADNPSEISVKQENINYQPSSDYVAALATLPQHYLHRTARPVVPDVKTEIDQQKSLSHHESDYEPQSALVEAVQQFQARRRSPPASNPVKSEPFSTDQTLPTDHSRDPKKRPRYYDDGPQKRIKTEKR